jgi:hypothetical protein
VDADEANEGAAIDLAGKRRRRRRNWKGWEWQRKMQ